MEVGESWGGWVLENVGDICGKVGEWWRRLEKVGEGLRRLVKV